MIEESSMIPTTEGPSAGAELTGDIGETAGLRDPHRELQMSFCVMLRGSSQGLVDRAGQGVGKGKRLMAGKRPRTIDEYLAGQTAENRAALQKARKAVHAAAPKAEECISYGMPAFV